MVDRNRLKRITREAFRETAALLPPYDYLVYYRRAVLDLEGRRLAQALRDAFAACQA